MTIDVLCVGITAYDMVFPMSGYPLENSKARVDEVLECGGGCAANAACLLAKWGVATAFGGVVGTDRYGELLAADFEACGVDIRLLDRRDGHPTPLSCILVNEETGSRTIINRRRNTGPCVFPKTVLAATAPAVLLFDSHELEASLEAMAAFPDARTILDAGTVRDAAIALGAQVDYLVASQDFAQQYTDMAEIVSDEQCIAALEALAGLNPKTCVITLGENGVVHLCDDGSLCRTPALPVDAIDTTGAGDLFHGAFAYGVLRGLPLADCIGIANRAAGLSVMKTGGRTSIPELREVVG